MLLLGGIYCASRSTSMVILSTLVKDIMTKHMLKLQVLGHRQFV